MLIRRIWPHRSEVAFWSLWLTMLAAFVALAAWAGHRYYLPGDRYVTFSVQELYRYAWADALFGVVNDFGERGTIVLVLIAAFAVLIARGLRFEALMLAGTGAVSYVQLAVRALVHRPDEQIRAMHASFDGLALPRLYPGTGGFPSGHVFGEWIIYGLIFAYAPRALVFKPLAWAVRALCLAEIALGGPARMYVGAHWFSDVLGAALLAGLYLLLAWRIDGMIAHLRAVARERELAAEAGLRHTAQPAAAMTTPGPETEATPVRSE